MNPFELLSRNVVFDDVKAGETFNQMPERIQLSFIHQLEELKADAKAKANENRGKVCCVTVNGHTKEKYFRADVVFDFVTFAPVDFILIQKFCELTVDQYLDNILEDKKTKTPL
jgi:hypothetical protein